jgi:lysophospholipase L1-like esterase
MFSPTRRVVFTVVLLMMLLTPLAPGINAIVSVRYTALGDSIAVGLWTFFGYVPRYATFVQRDTGVFPLLVNLGFPGFTSAQLRNAVENDDLFRRAVSRSRIVTFNIGGNDLRAARQQFKAGACGPNQECLVQTVIQLKENWNAIVATLLQLRGSKPTIFRTMDIYNPFVNEDKAQDTVGGDSFANDFELLKVFLDDVNAHIAGSCAATAFECAEVYAAFNGPNGDEDPGDAPRSYISFDGYHPNNAGHRAIANALRALGYN